MESFITFLDFVLKMFFVVYWIL